MPANPERQDDDIFFKSELSTRAAKFVRLGGLVLAGVAVFEFATSGTTLVKDLAHHLGEATIHREAGEGVLSVLGIIGGAALMGPISSGIDDALERHSSR